MEKTFWKSWPGFLTQLAISGFLGFLLALAAKGFLDY